MNDYSKEEFLAGYQCEDCKEVNTVSRSTKLETAPEHLVMKLTRTDDKGKIQTPVRLPKTVIFGTVTGKVRYQIISFVKHSGKR